MKYGFLDFILDQLYYHRTVPPVASKDLQGLTVIITGGNVGLGFEAAKHLARMNPGRLIITSRDQKRGEEALAAIKAETGCQNAEMWTLDLANFASVDAFADRFEKEGGGRLDILLENASAAPNGKFELTGDGWELLTQVNHLSTSLLALLLLPQMVATAKKYQTKPRLVIVSSGVHYFTRVDDEVLDSDTPLRVFGQSAEYNVAKVLKRRYFDSKLLEVFFTRAFNDRIKNVPVIVTSVTPGYCYSSLRRNYRGLEAFVDVLMEKALAYTTEEGGRQILWPAVSEDVDPEELRGGFVVRDQVVEPSDFVISERGVYAQNKLWDDLVDELIKINPKVKNIIEEHLMKPSTSAT